MKRRSLASDIPIRSALIAWQPLSLPRNDRGALPGQVTVFKFPDPRDRSFAMTHGACWVAWAEQPVDELIQTLRWLKREMVRDYGISPEDIEAAFSDIPEYRLHRAHRGTSRRR